MKTLKKRHLKDISKPLAVEIKGDVSINFTSPEF